MRTRLDDQPALPEVIRRYLEAHDKHDTEVALSAFASDATVVDEDREFQGSISTASSPLPCSNRP